MCLAVHSMRSAERFSLSTFFPNFHHRFSKRSDTSHLVSMEAYLDGIPRSTSSMSLSASNSSSTLDQQSAPTSSRSTSSSYWTSSISSVWSGLKAAAGSEVKGFLKAVQGKVSGEDLGGRLGDKRRRGVQDGDLAGLGEPGMNKEAQAKRRKTDSDSSKSLGEFAVYWSCLCRT